jgi:hypothetical protein
VLFTSRLWDGGLSGPAQRREHPRDLVDGNSLPVRSSDNPTEPSVRYGPAPPMSVCSALEMRLVSPRKVESPAKSWSLALMLPLPAVSFTLLTTAL